MTDRPASRDTHRREAAERLESLRVSIVTISDSRTPETDVNADFLRAALAAAGHQLAAYRIVPDDARRILECLEEVTALDSQVILCNGGTGFSRRDSTFEALSGALEQTLTGFGELFRMLSYEQVGAAAMLSRATAGIFRGCLVFSTPGSPQAVRLAWEKLIAPEIRHLAWELRR